MASLGLAWFRRDLRLDDNPVWAAATAAHTEVAALFVVDDVLMRSAGDHRRHQLIAELWALDETLARHGGRLLVHAGDPIDVVPRVVSRLGGDRVYWNADVTPYASRRDRRVQQRLSVPVTASHGHLVLPPGAVATREGHVHRVFGAFHRAWGATPWDPWPQAGDASVLGDPGDGLPEPAGDAVRPPGEGAATAALEDFAAGPVDRYESTRDDLAIDGTSNLAVALRFGTVSPRHVVARIGDSTDGRRAFNRQLAWRDWFAHLLAEIPSLPTSALRSEYDLIEWRDDPTGLRAWREGQTGYPIVDAGMRQLASTGVMPNRVRMITASFLVKDLLIDWRLGERHFRRLLVDGDLPQNVGNWQWVAGTGPDAAPYFRVFNAVAQSRRYDPHGSYLRRWLPELAQLDDEAIHAPWECSALELAAAEVTLGQTYPEPIVDHAMARERTLAAYRAARDSTHV